ncbi:fluoride efflux transporter CrcB [Paenibacillus doosanensis]|uniref:Fluoride-specific ion channel FluC n=1 Tax=Paenibacillus konkukensis TaxID=2020716 RepID=A0ABY4RH26_9BACL|nr:MULTISPECIES: fluoride efflux transporter CrcB [Paenibacillus]MCS7461939.1 fluoride efflux transporter CrcB [Paenibacillus doosanensis]UQZ81450.1 Putative fluoride ion transporter CrcB [Paenibacillus konkukensis]
MNIIAVGLFGAAGALLRYLMGLWIHGWWPSPFPFGTLIINLLGCLMLGWFSTWAASLASLPSWLRLGFGTGFVGAFTTFSTFSVETVNLIHAELWGSALLYVMSSFIGGLVFAWAGYEIFQIQLRRKSKGVQPS